MSNLSKIRRDKMIEFLETLKEQHSDDESLIAINQIEKELLSKRYGLVWEEHEEAVDVMMRDNIPVFTEVKEREICMVPGEDYNFLLEGDNLHSLHLLEKTHRGKVDVIYIDPPYNTKNKDFIYDDNMVGEDDDFKHSKWLSFMEKRLSCSHALLNEEGIIFISINDYEGAQVKLLCDELFGENNFIGQLTWESTTQPTNAGVARFALQKKVESIYCYAKNKAKRRGFVLKEMEGDLKYPHEGRFGKCRFEIIEKSDAGAYKRDTMKFSILGQFPREGKRWQIGEDTARELENQGKIEIVDGIVKRAIYPEDGGQRKFILCTNNENNICEGITYQRIKTVITGKRQDGSEYSEGIPANLKYYHTDFVHKSEEYLADSLLNHVTEMIQLEHGVRIDDDSYIMIMSDDEADELEKKWNEYTDIKAIYVSQDVLLTASQEALFESVDIYIIPDYYFNFELREAGELW